MSAEVSSLCALLYALENPLHAPSSCTALALPRSARSAAEEAVKHAKLGDGPMAANKAPLLPLSAVSVEKKMKKQQHQPHIVCSRCPPFLPGVRDVIKWALFHAGCVALSVAFALIVTGISGISHTDPPSWLLPRPAAELEEITGTAADVAFTGMVLWFVCVVSQAAAGALALLLPRHRLLLAYAALVATTAGHCMWAGLYIMLFVAPGVFSFWNGFNTVVFFVVAVGDLLCFRGLILRGGEE